MRHQLSRAGLSRALVTSVVAGTGALAALAGPASAFSSAASDAADPSAAVIVFSKFEARHSGQVMDVPGFSHGVVQVNQFPWNGGQNQQWNQNFTSNTPFQSNANTPPFELIARHSGKCLDIKGGSSTAASVPLVQATCDGTPSQKWYTHKLADVGLLTGKGYRFIYNVHSGHVIDVGNVSQAPGAGLFQFPQKPLSQADNQLWYEDFGGIG